MSLNNLKINIGYLPNGKGDIPIYAGYINRNQKTWRNKKDITFDIMNILTIWAKEQYEKHQGEKFQYGNEYQYIVTIHDAETGELKRKEQVSIRIDERKE